MWLGWMDIARWVSKVEKPCEVRLDKEESVEAMTVEQVESVDWTEVPMDELDVIP